MKYTQAESRRRPGWAVRAAVAGAGAVALLGIAAPAAADVSVTPTEAAQGGAADLTFRITNDSPSASVTAIDLQLPADAPIAEVYPLSVDDWAPSMTNVKVDKPLPSLHGYQITEVTTAVKWIAMPDKALAPGKTTELYLSIGPLPAVDKLSFGLVLTNSDGTQVSRTAQAGGPVLALKPGGPVEHAGAHGGATPAATADAADTTDTNAAAGAPSGSPSYLMWSLAALLLIAVICVVSVILQQRRTPAPEKPAEDAVEDPEMVSAP
ncbi:DUF1775 domain-containing protein [Dactylosporangium sp. McL0621]|uniref:DUF1775 domain-containing protein n=1 Tax=Dactylosporangium sp. McL0621 TaxID=3415678 RepID=UPI003CF8C995